MDILIYGSCVSRDALEFDKVNSLKLKDYFARSSLASSMSSKKISTVPTINIKSSFQQRMVESDLNKKASDLIREGDYDVLLMDFIDERFDLWVQPDGSICTISNELISSGFTPPKAEVIKSGTDEWFYYWESGWVELLELLNESCNIQKLIINEVYWSQKTISDEDYLPNYSSVGIDAANKSLRRIYERVRHDICDAQIIIFDQDELVGAHSHKWGRSPFHYQDVLYEKIVYSLYTHRKNQHDGFVHSPDPFCDFIILSAPLITDLQFKQVRSTSIKLGLNIIRSEQLIVISNSVLQDSIIVSGYGSHHGKPIAKLSKQDFSNGIGNYTACIIHDSGSASVHQDYFGMSANYYMQDEHCAIVSNRAQLAFAYSNIFGVNNPNKNNIYSKLLEHFFFSGQAFNNETPINGVLKVPLSHKVIISSGKVELINNSPVHFNSNYSYEQALKIGVDELKAITKNALDMLVQNGDVICCDLSGGKDSRAALAVLMSICSSKYYIRTNDVASNDDLDISIKIASYFNLAYIDHTNDLHLPISYEDGITVWRSYFMGDYHRMGLPNSSTYGNSNTIRIGGGAGEIYRDFWSKILNQSYLDDVNDVLDSLVEKELPFLDGISNEDIENLSKYIKTSFYSEVNDSQSFSALSKHYLNFRNRSHFGMRHFSTFNDALYVFPLLSPCLFQASLLLNEKERESGKLMYDIIHHLQPRLNEFEYDGGFPFADTIIKEKIVIDDKIIDEKRKEWAHANVNLRKNMARTSPIKKKIKEKCLNDILDCEVASSLLRMKWTLKSFNGFVDVIYNKYKKSKKISHSSARSCASIIFSVDDALHPLYSQKEKITKSAVAEYGNEYFDPISSCGFINSVRGWSVYLRLKDDVVVDDYLFAYYIFQDGIRTHTFWYCDKTEQALDIDVTQGVRLAVFAKDKKSNKVFISESVYN